MTMTDKGEILEEIGRLVDVQLNGNSENCFLYAEIEENMGEAYILEDGGDRMIFHVADMEIFWAAMAIGAQDRQGLERLGRYLLRPLVAKTSLSQETDGSVVV